MSNINTVRPSVRRRAYLLPVFLAFAVFLPSFFGLEVNRWLQAALAILFAGMLFFALREPRGAYRLRLIDGALAGFLIFSFASIWISGSRLDSVTQWTWLLLFTVSFWITRAYRWNTSTIQFLRWSLTIAVTLASVIALGMWLQSPTQRLTGLLFNANAAGPFFAAGAFLAASLINETTRRRRGLASASLTLIVLAFFLTASYTAWAASAAALVVLFLARRFAVRAFRRHAIVFASVIAAILLAVALPRLMRTTPTSSASVVIPASHVSSSFSQRLEFNRVAIEEFLDHPILGVGLSRYQNVYPPYAVSIAEQPRYVHNYFLQVFAETGLLGGLLFSLFLVLLLRRCWRILRDQNVSAGLVSLAVAIVALTFAALVDFSWQFPAVFLCFWIFSGVLTSQRVSESAISELANSPSANRQFANSPIRSLLLGVLALLLFLRGVSLALAQMAFDEAEAASPAGEFERAVAAYNRGVRFDPDPQALRERAWLQLLVDLHSEQFDRTERAIADLRRGNDGDYFAHHAIGRIRFVQDRFNEAEAEYGRALELDPVFHPDFAYDLGFLYLKQQRYADAQRVAAEMLGRYSTIPFSSNPYLQTQLAALHYLLGEVAYAQGDQPLALKRMDDSVALDPNFGPAKVRRGEIEGQIDAAPKAPVN